MMIDPVYRLDLYGLSSKLSQRHWAHLDQEHFSAVSRGSGRFNGVQSKTPFHRLGGLRSGMVESNHDEERLARIEQMIEALQREQVAIRVATTKLVAVVATFAGGTLTVKPARSKSKRSW